MRKNTVAIFVTLAMILGFSPSRAAFTYEDTFVIESLQTISGDITDVDSDHKSITVRWMADEVLLKYQDLTLDVPDSAVITKNSERIELNDLESGDPATVRFDSNAQPLPKAVSITVTE